MSTHSGRRQGLGLIHSLVTTTTTAGVQDPVPAVGLLHGDGDVLDGNAGDQGIAKRPEKVNVVTARAHLNFWRAVCCWRQHERGSSMAGGPDWT